MFPEELQQDYPNPTPVCCRECAGMVRTCRRSESSIAKMFKYLNLLILLFVFFTACDPGYEHDIVIRNGTIVDGAGKPRFRGDIAINGNLITNVGTVDGAGRKEIDAQGKIVAPGFIDTHSHHDWEIFEKPDALAAVSQGITTLFIGQDGFSSHPMPAFTSRLKRKPAAVNIASFAGHNTLRELVLGQDFRRTATASEIEKMSAMLAADMEAGAWGLSSGLEYDPGIYSNLEEVIELARIAAAKGGRYISHIRSEDRYFWEAIDEIISVGEIAQIPVQISHLKLALQRLLGRTDELKEKLDKARLKKIAISADVYPYTYWQSTMQVLFPERNFNDRSEAEFVLSHITTPAGITFTQYDPNPDYTGRTLQQISELRNEDPPATLLALLAETLDKEDSESIIAESMREEDIIDLIQWKYTNICTDGGSDGGHPRGYGTYPRVLGKYVRENGWLTLEEAIYKMTGLAAQNMGLKGRGVLKAGNYADMVIFDPETIIDKATYQNSTAVSEGMEAVFVNGRPVFLNNKTTRYRPGKFLYGPGYNVEQCADELTAYFNRQINADDPGVALMVRKDARIIYQRGFGLADLETKENIDSHSSFRMASVSKQFFAAAILICQEKGLLTVKDPVTKYISNQYFTGITIEHLVHHTSGIADYYDEAFKTWKGSRNRNNADMIKYFKESYRLPYFQPGEKYQYCNPGYELIVTIIETVSGQNIYDFMDEHVFSPLGLNETQVFEGIKDFHCPQRVMGYTKKKGKFGEDDYTFLNGIIGAGGLYTSLNDYSKWLDALDNQTLLSAGSMAMMYEPARLNDGSMAAVDDRTLKDFLFPDDSTYSSYGFGWVLTKGKESAVSHSGSWVGFRNYVFRNLDSGVDIIMFSNRGGALEKHWFRSVLQRIDKTIMSH